VGSITHAKVLNLTVITLLILALVPEPLTALTSAEIAEPAPARMVSNPSVDLAVPDAGTNVQVQASDAMRSAPLMFIENAGQSPDGARFQVRGGDRTIWLAEDAIWVTVLEPHPSPRPPDGGPPSPLSAAERGEVRGVNLKLSFVGANAHPRLEPFDRLDTHVSYFIGNDPTQWRTDVPVWGGVRYVDL
jgi:hypothetical protein